MGEVVVTALGRHRYGALGVVAVPQVIRTCRTRSAGDISGIWLAVALLSMAMWIAYGGVTGAHAVLWANLITALRAAIILRVKLASSRKIYAQSGLET